jgi:uncharacterized protein YqiB (DUF1249 family)
MTKRKQSQVFGIGTEVITDDLRIAVVERQRYDKSVIIRYHTPPWPFPEMDVKMANQLTRVKFDFEEALM